MMTVAVLVGAIAALGSAGIGYVAWRDRRRLSSPDDSAAGRIAAAQAERAAAERHGAQGLSWQEGQRDSP